MSRTTMLRTFACLVLLAMLAAACGQKEGVHVGFAGAGGVGGAVGMATEGVPTFTDADGDGIDDVTNLSQDEFAQAASSGQLGTGTGTGTSVASSGGGTSAGGSGTTSGGTSSGGTAPSGSSGGGNAPDSSGGGDDSNDDGGGAPPPSGGDSTGVTAKTITIGVHAPLTGAAPLPASSFKTGKDQYWKYKGHTVAGRTVEVVFRDDKYNPSTASQVCQEMIAQDKVFLLIGAAGTDQIAECARVAAAAGVPYLSAGVTELRLNQLANYFALSFSYADQMPLLMQMITKEAKPSNGKVGLIASDTANFDDAVQAFEEAAKAAKFTPVVYRPSKQPSQVELATLARQMNTDGISVATPVIAPTQWINLAPQVPNTRWRGIGVTMGVNQAGDAACKATQSVDGAAFFSPWPGLNVANQMDPKFADAGGTDDIQWSFWGLNKQLHAAFSKMGNNLTRGAFVKAMTGSVNGGIYPATQHTSSDHFRAAATHVVRLECSGSGGTYKSGPSDIHKKSF